jgi:hypothetical protein
MTAISKNSQLSHTRRLPTGMCGRAHVSVINHVIGSSWEENRGGNVIGISRMDNESHNDWIHANRVADAHLHLRRIKNRACL